MSDYKSIKGVRYAKDLLDLADELVSGKGDGRISQADIEQITKSALDGPGLTDTERRTLAYIIQNYNFTDKAREWFLKDFVRGHQAKHLKVEAAGISTYQSRIAEVLADIPIPDRATLIQYLKDAARLELTTIPLYLTSLYSIKNPTRGDGGAFDYVLSIAIEEMLHLGLVSNLLTSLGEPLKLYVDPDLDSCSPFPVFNEDTVMPHRDPALPLNTGSLTKERIEKVFMGVELPEYFNIAAFNKPAKRSGRDSCGLEYTFATIGQFYGMIDTAIDTLTDEDFGQVGNQVPQSNYYDSPRTSYFVPATAEKESGVMKTVSSREEAKGATKIIVDQGEGNSSGDHNAGDSTELSHYYKFEELIATGADPLPEVYNFKENPKQVDYDSNPKLKSLSDVFNSSYCVSLCVMETIWDTTHDNNAQTSLLNKLYNMMNHAMSRVAMALAAQPLDGTYNAAPTFEFYTLPEGDLATRLSKVKELTEDALAIWQDEDQEIATMLSQLIQVFSRTLSTSIESETVSGNYTFDRDIRPLVNGRDIGGMKEYSSSYDLSKYDTWVNHGDRILSKLQSNMPPAGPYFTQVELDIIKAWLVDKVES